MNLEALPKYYSPKSPKLSDDAPATGSGGLTITDVMAAWCLAFHHQAGILSIV